jgi:hypothetical protein
MRQFISCIDFRIIEIAELQSKDSIERKNMVALQIRSTGHPGYAAQPPEYTRPKGLMMDQPLWEQDLLIG